MLYTIKWVFFVRKKLHKFLCKKYKFYVCWQFVKFYQEKLRTELPLSTDPLLDLFSASHGYVVTHIEYYHVAVYCQWVY